MNEYVNELNEVLNKLQSMKIEATYANVRTMAECIEIIMNVGNRILADSQKANNEAEQSQPEIVRTEEI